MSSLADEWRDFKKVVPPEAPLFQVEQTRAAFYAGATVLFSLLMYGLEPGRSPTESDLRKVDELKAEIDEFWVEVKRKQM